MTKRKSDPEGCENLHTPPMPAVLRFGGLSKSRSSTGGGTPSARGFKKPRILSESSSPLKDVSASRNINVPVKFQTNANTSAGTGFITPSTIECLTNTPSVCLDVNSNISLVNGQTDDPKRAAPVFISAGSKKPIVLTSEIGKITARSLNCWLDCLKDSDEDGNQELITDIQDTSHVSNRNDDEELIDPEADDYLTSLDLSTLY